MRFRVAQKPTHNLAARNEQGDGQDVNPSVCFSHCHIPRKSTGKEETCRGTVTQTGQEKMSHTGDRCKTEALIQTARKAQGWGCRNREGSQEGSGLALEGRLALVLFW